MKQKIYNSFDQINSELEILKLERDISYHKFILSFDKTKEHFQPHSIRREIFSYLKERISESYKSLLVIGIPYILKILNKKREAN